MKFYEIIKKEEYTNICGSLDVTIEKITSDPSQITSSTLFVFLRSERFDINLITEKVLKSDPIAILCDEELYITKTKATVIRVKDTRVVLPFLYFRFYRLDSKKLKLCGVTGTNGKTSTAFMLRNILINAGYKVGFIGTGKIMINEDLISNTNYSMTTPDPELLYKSIAEMTEKGCAYIVMEVSSHALHFNKVLPLQFEVSIFTNLSSEHLDFHKNIYNYYKSKLKLFKQSKFGVFNIDDKYSARAMKSFNFHSVSVSTKHKADYLASRIVTKDLTHTKYVLTEFNRRYTVRLGTVGKFNVYNSMMAIAAANLLGIHWSVAKESVENTSSIDGRMELIKGDVNVIIDYAHTPDAFRNVLNLMFKCKKTRQSLISVFGCGGERDKAKRPLMAEIAEKYSNLVIVTSDNSRNENTDEIITDIIRGFKFTDSYRVIVSREEAIEEAIINANSGDIIALLGKGHERYNITKGNYEPFDEREIIKKALIKRRSSDNDNGA